MLRYTSFEAQMYKIIIKYLKIACNVRTVGLVGFMMNGTVINTAENHPFYVEGKGWCAASELEYGDVLRTQDKETELVENVRIEQLGEADTTDTINQNSNKDCEELSQLIKKVNNEKGDHSIF